jgi:antitoxin component YwqK of YwqJK toxin-antitoxin module
MSDISERIPLDELYDQVFVGQSVYTVKSQSSKWPYWQRGQKHGQYTMYYGCNKRAIKFVTNYNHGVEDGARIEYYPSSRLKKISHFSRGAADGEHIEYFDTEKCIRKFQCYYQDGVLVGDCIYYNEDGSVQSLRSNIQNNNCIIH